MKIEQSRWSVTDGWAPLPTAADADLVLAFGSTEALNDAEALAELTRRYSRAAVLGCSTAGEVLGPGVWDDGIVVTAARFERSRVLLAETMVAGVADSRGAGERLARQLNGKDLVHVFVLSDGLSVNGSELVKGLSTNLPASCAVTGGLAADGESFRRTFVVGRDGAVSGRVAAVGFYGAVKIGYGSQGGWDPFGPERLVTRSKGGVLYELDGKSGLELYKRYLGDHARSLPASGLLYPLSVRVDAGRPGVVRTILSTNEDEQSMTFAGDVPEGAYARLMKANPDRLIDGAVAAARTSLGALGRSAPELAVLISCVGRRMVLGQRVEEEIEGVREVVGVETALSGFYSYGEIAPFGPASACELHNQTMTVTAFSES